MIAFRVSDRVGTFDIPWMDLAERVGPSEADDSRRGNMAIPCIFNEGYLIMTT